jgi:ABC-type nitrate/sulfonate/bicarbonate transport system permease component
MSFSPRMPAPPCRDGQSFEPVRIGPQPDGASVPQRADKPVVQHRSAEDVAAPVIRPQAKSHAIGSKIWRNYHAAIRGTYSVILALIAWELVGRYLVTSKLMFAPLSAVLAEFVKLWGTGELERDMLASFTALACGFAVAGLVGVAIGSLIGISDAVGEHLDPLINALYATPLVALSPILILSLGIGPASKVAVVFMLAVFPILINTTVGIKSADESLIEAARSFAATRLDIFLRVLLPSALPFIVAGLRLGVGRGLVGIFIGELFGAREGLGYLISMSGQTFDIPGMFVGVLVLAISGVVCVALFEYIERRIAPWRQFDLKA